MKYRILSFSITVIALIGVLSSCQQNVGTHTDINVPLDSLIMSQGLIGFSESQEVEYDYLWFDNLNAMSYNKVPITYFWESLLQQKNYVCETDDKITRAEYLKFDLLMCDGSQHEIWLLYDYDSRMEYIWYENKLYHICFSFPWEWDTWISGVLWYGPARDYMMNMDEYNVFRYQPHWPLQDRSVKLLVNVEIATKREISSGTEAIEATSQLFLNQSLDDAKWYYDETTQLWLVRLKFSEPLDISSIVNCTTYAETQNNLVRHIYAIWQNDGAMIECGIWS